MTGLTGTTKPPSDSQPPRQDTLNALDDRRIREIKPLVPPQILMEDLPLSQAAYTTIRSGREACERIIQGMDTLIFHCIFNNEIHATW
jgi:3-deoxy-7-phosphoheptulonate synthase